MKKSAFGQISSSEFIPPMGMSNRHLQTIIPKFYLSAPSVKVETERVPTQDGDFLDLAWAVPSYMKALVLTFHGLEGSVNSHYVKHLFTELNAQQIGGVLMHFRGCGGQSNRTPRAYHSGETQDPWFILQLLIQRYPDLPIFIVGFSLGGNVTLKLLAEQQNLKLAGAVAVSAPVDLAASSQTINKGLARFYQAHLLRSMKRNLLTKMTQINMQKHLDITVEDIKKIDSFYHFDDRVTAPLHGFRDADDYYTRASSKPHLVDIKTKTLILHATDDPFMDARVIPTKREISSSIAYELSDYGGHVGFLQRHGRRYSTWLPQRITSFINEVL